MQPDNRARLKQWLESGEARLQPLSLSQRELWETSPIPVGDPGNYICSFIEIKGALTENECATALQRVVDRQEALRISFLPGKERPLQLVRSTATAPLRYRELSSEEAKPESLEEVLKETYREPFDLMQGPIFRVDMLRRGPNDHVLAFAIHHGVADGWSLGVFVQDLCTAYVMGLTGVRKAVAVGMMGVPNSLPPVPQTYTEWAAAERALWPAAEVSQRADFWRSQLKGSRQIWSRADGTPHTHEPLQRWISNIPANLTRAVKELTRKESATLFSTLLAAFQVALGKWANRDDIVVGTPVANRNKASAKQTMGYFAGVVPLRGQVDPSRAFSDHLRAVHETAINAFGNAMPFAELAAALGEPQAKGLHSIFDVRFALQNHPTPDVVLPRISTKLRMRSTGTARFDLGCEITETGSDMELVWLFKPGLFPRADINALDALFLSVLSQVCKNPGNQNSTLIV
jgi:hypothetical protein